MPNAELKMRLLTQLCCGHTHLVISQSPGKAFLFLNNFFLKLLSPLMKLSWLPIFTVFPQNKCMPQRNEVCGIFFLWRNSSSWAQAASFLRFTDHAQWT